MFESPERDSDWNQASPTACSQLGLRVVTTPAARSISVMAGRTPGRSSPLKQWSAWLPIAIPVFLLVLGLRYVALHGVVGQADEGTEAHLFQLLMPVQLVVMAYFALTWLPRAPRRTLVVLALQVAAAIAVLAAVYWVDHLPSTG